MPVVYMATNVIDGKRYIGATKHTLDIRKDKHLHNAFRANRDCGYFYAALRKHGADNFDWRLLKQCNSVDEAFSEEVRFIADLKPEYNLTTGGDRPHPLVRKPTKKVICLDDGRIFDSATLAAEAYSSCQSTISQACTGKIRIAAGHHFAYYAAPLSSEERQKMIFEIEISSAKRRIWGKKRFRKNNPVVGGVDKLGRAAVGPMKNAKPIICITTGARFPSISAAAAFYDIIDKAGIAQVCRGDPRRQTVSGLVFKFAEVV